VLKIDACRGFAIIIPFPYGGVNGFGKDFEGVAEKRAAPVTGVALSA
jgi:hypothetical protein